MEGNFMANNFKKIMHHILVKNILFIEETNISTTVQRLLVLIKLCNFAFNFLAPGANTIASKQENHRRRQLWLVRLPDCDCLIAALSVGDV